MPRRLLITLSLILAAFSAALVLLPDVSPRSAAAYSCGPTAPNVAPAKLQIRVYGQRVEEVNWAFNVTPNPFTFGGQLRVTDNQAPDLSVTKADMLLEGVCTATVPGDFYTVSLAPDVIPPCPMIQTTITHQAPAPTTVVGDPYTAAFYFTLECPPPTPIPTPTFIPSPTPIPTATPLPGPPTAIVSITPNNILCNSSAAVQVMARQNAAPVPDGTIALLTTSLGTLAQSQGPMLGGVFTTQLSVSQNTASSGVVRAIVNGVQAQGTFTTSACASETLSQPPAPPPAAPVVFQTGSVGTIRPPSTGDAGLVSLQ